VRFLLARGNAAVVGILSTNPSLNETRLAAGIGTVERQSIEGQVLV
jgi:hypothetical protein